MSKQAYRKRMCLPFWTFLTLSLLAFAGSMMFESRSFHLNDFYDVGKVYDMLLQEDGVLGADGIAYDETTGIYTVVSEDAKLKFPKASKAFQYYFFKLEADNLNSDGITAKFCYYDAGGNRIAEQLDRIGKGENTYTIPVAGDFSQVKLIIKKQKGVTFSIKKAQVWERLHGFNKKSFLKTFLVFWLCFLLLAQILWVLSGVYKRKLPQEMGGKSGGIIHGLSSCLFRVYRLGERPARFIDRKLGKNRKKEWIPVLFCILFTYMTGMNRLGIYAHNDYYKYHMLFAAALLTIIAWLCYDGKFRDVRYNKTGKIWFVLWGMVCISDAVAGNRFLCVGYLMIFAVGNLFYFWVNMNRPGGFSERFYLGLKLFFLISLAGYGGNAMKAGNLAVSGIFASCGDYGWFLLLMVVCLWAEASERLQRHQYHKENGKRLPIRKTIFWSFYFIAAAVLLILMAKFSLQKEDVPGSLQRMKYAFYGISDLNLFGHGDNVLNGGRRVWMHNGLLELLYRYGIFILVPYILLFFGVLKAQVKRLAFSRPGMPGRFRLIFSMAVTIVFGVALLCSNLEQPFLSPLWCSYYLLMGEYLVIDRRRKMPDNRRQQ